MSSSIKKENNVNRDISLLNFISKLKLADPFSIVYLNRHEKYIYQDTRNISFKNTLPEFQRIMKQEFKDVIKYLKLSR